ncbi:lysine--tRNA ligase [Candidatus Mycoplasma haematohominis]|uniref:lysine--tRNA ligase n=1 Tax=Candidatus Mycoplasma haematohominis TaxID=1494318 RepID=UPI001C0A6FA5|nr:lysine--tRNA ligase [Candidatus Mycoplasma haemohominis]
MNDQERDRRKKWESLKKNNLDPYSLEKVECDFSIAQIGEKFKKLSDYDLNNLNVSFIGRVVSIRQSFLNVRDGWDSLQVYVSNKDCSKELLECFKSCLDIGDVIYVKGSCFKTKTGIPTVKVKDFKIVSKCLNPFPSEYYGIQNEELKVRNRVGRALIDQQFFNNLLTRSKIISQIREYLNSRGYVEFETPILEQVYGGANAVPFVTHFEALKEDFFLRIATEISLKKAAIAGFSKVYEIGKVFRNEGIDSTHNPEFTSIEIYTMNYGLKDVMDLTENLIHYVSDKLGIKDVLIGEKSIDISKPFKRISMTDLVKEKTKIDFYRDEVTLDDALYWAKKYLIELEPFEKTVGHIFTKLFEKLVEGELMEPTFVYCFHKDVSPLAKSDPVNKDFVLRYELYIGGKEFSNGFAELNDPDDQRERFEKQKREKIDGNKEAFGVDESYLFALKYGLPPTGGIGIGIDRLVMLFTQQKSIKDVIFIPQIKKNS